MCDFTSRIKKVFHIKPFAFGIIPHIVKILLRFKHNDATRFVLFFIHTSLPPRASQRIDYFGIDFFRAKLRREVHRLARPSVEHSRIIASQIELVVSRVLSIVRGAMTRTFCSSRSIRSIA